MAKIVMCAGCVLFCALGCVIVALAAALILVLTLKKADGYSCYQCSDSNDGEDVNETSSCGHLLDNRKKCVGITDLNNFPTAFHPFIEAQNNASRSAVAGKKEIDWICAKFVVGSVGTVRLCMIDDDNAEDECEEGTVKEIATGDSIWQLYALPYLPGYGSNNFTGCVCSGENCNSGLSIKFSFTLLVSSLILALLKN